MPIDKDKSILMVAEKYRKEFEQLSEKAFEQIHWANLPENYLYTLEGNMLHIPYNSSQTLGLIVGIVEGKAIFSGIEDTQFGWKAVAFLVNRLSKEVKKESLLTRKERALLIVFCKAFLAKLGRGDISYHFLSGACVAWKAVSVDDMNVILVAMEEAAKVVDKMSTEENTNAG